MTSTATSPSRSERRAPAPPLALIADASSEAVRAFQRALVEAGCAAAQVVDYRAVLDDPLAALAALPAGSWLRLESPGRAEDLRRALIARGVELGAGDPLGQGGSSDGARMVQPPAWARGFGDLLERLRAVAAARALEWVQAPASVARCFDKLDCDRVLARAGVAVPRALGRVEGFEPLRARMVERETPRVFVKPRFGSSGSGCIALASDRGRYRAYTSVELVAAGGRLLPYNSRRVRLVQGEAQVAQLVDALGGHELIAQAWVPKAGFAGQAGDLRLLWIDGELACGVLRTARFPITNLHLGGQRHALDRVRAQVRDEVWQRLGDDCQRVARALPGMMHLGLDVALLAGLRSHRVLEVNAFGDRLHGVLQHGASTQALQVRALQRRWAAARGQEAASC